MCYRYGNIDIYICMWLKHKVKKMLMHLNNSNYRLLYEYGEILTQVCIALTQACPVSQRCLLQSIFFCICTITYLLYALTIL